MKTNRKHWEQHWITPLAFLPFSLLLIVHRLLGLSDAMKVMPTPGERDSLFYNLVMVIAFWIGVIVYLTHTGLMARHGRIWVVVKLIALAIAWTVFLVFALR